VTESFQALDQILLEVMLVQAVEVVEAEPHGRMTRSEIYTDWCAVTPFPIVYLRDHFGIAHASFQRRRSQYAGKRLSLDAKGDCGRQAEERPSGRTEDRGPAAL
jgi:hypothetical protein